MGLRRARPMPALVVPDEETWLVSAKGQTTSAFEPTSEPGRAGVMLLPERIPRGLVEAVRSEWARMPVRRSTETYEAPLPGVRAQEVLESGGASTAGGEADDEEEEDEADPHGHEGGDMMAITGEPSADGLVMEDLEVEAGPLGVALPGGLTVHAKLDGDVVTDCRVRQTLREDDQIRPPDVWSAVAWSVAELTVTEALAGAAAGAEGRWFRRAAVEVERAISHLAWLHGLCRLLAWPRMTERVRSILARFVAARGSLPVELTTPELPGVPTDAINSRLLEAQSAAEALGDDLSESRLLARRTTGLGYLSGPDASSRGLEGPAARASGLPRDARSEDAGYLALGFEPVVRNEGDARARALVRTREAAQSARLARASIARAKGPEADDPAPSFGARPAGVVEGARGPVQVVIAPSGQPQRTAPGARAVRQAAAELAVGREWAAALVTVASFDISPWRVAP